MNILILSKNYEKYGSGNYHDDIIRAFKKKASIFLWGEGYEGYDSNLNINDVLKIAEDFLKNKIDCVICSTSWDDDKSESNVNPNQKINLSKLNIPTVYFINKEYKKFEQRIEYIKKNNFDIIYSTHPDCIKWKEEYKLNFKFIPFAIDIENFKYKNDWKNRKWDFIFTGGLHKTHTDERYNAKRKIFKEKYLKKKTNLNYLLKPKRYFISEKLMNYNIYWAEWGSKNIFNRSLLPIGKKYENFLRNSKISLCTLSAQNILGTRFFELMATGTIILMPKTDLYSNILIENETCFMYKNDFEEKLLFILNNESIVEKIRLNALNMAKKNDYLSRINYILEDLEYLRI